MNARQRFLSVLAFEPVDRTLLWEWGYWGATLRRWYGEGLPRRVGMDIVEVREAFPRLQILGGLDKIAFAAGGQAAAAELERKVPALLPAGGYIPYMDHYVHPEVAWADFLSYRRRLNAMIQATPGA